jgi:hypothetical protein
MIQANWLAWSIQILILSGVGYVAPRLLRMTDAKSRVLGAQFALVLCLAFPFLAQRIPRSGGVSITARGSLNGLLPGRRVPAPKPDKWSPLIPAILAAGAAVRLAGIAAGLWKLHVYRKSAGESAGPVEEAFRLTDTYRARVALSQVAQSPATFGLFRPIILLPRQYEALSQESQLAILCHELLHVRHFDWPVALLEEVAGALLWFQPFVYLLIADIRLAREQITDREAVALTKAKIPYVEALLTVASEPLAATLSMAPMFLHRRNLKSRVQFLLEEIVMSKKKMLFANVSLAALLGAAGWVSSVSFPLVAIAQEKTAQSEAAASPQATANFWEAFPAASGRRIRVGGNVAQNNLISKVNPVYPPMAKSAKIQGTVKLGVLIGEDGHLMDVVLVSGHPLLVTPSIDAVRQWVYRPTLLNGNPVEVITVIDVNYTLEQ